MSPAVPGMLPAEVLPDVLFPVTPPLDCCGAIPELPTAPGDACVLLGRVDLVVRFPTAAPRSCG